ncbi:MAG TPA: sigma-70 family RNA polymerase sigma factor [Micropepsaceae bacterium]|jgi:RNA polymerase sigma-70 factor (ECF subfamily)|nr:sigma-70 family RNA polymerase sigma factor [Micropepsaceae bacterium]
MDDKRRRFEAQALPHLDAAYNLARWLARSSGDADDIVQEAMMRAYRGFDGFRGGDAKPWLLAIVRNCFFTAAGQGRQKRTVSLPEDGAAHHDDAFVDAAPDPELALMQAQHGRKLNQIIAALPEEFREVLILREMEDLSYRDIAQITETPMGTVMSRLARARALLKARWLGDVEGVRDAVQ